MSMPILFLFTTALLVPIATQPGPTSSDQALRVAATEFSAQARKRPRIRIEKEQPPFYEYPRPGEYSWPGPGAVRQCVGWYATEYRPSGTVITPQRRCRWVRG